MTMCRRLGASMSAAVALLALSAGGASAASCGNGPGGLEAWKQQMAGEVYAAMLESGCTAAEAVAQLGIKAVRDTGELLAIVRRAVAARFAGQPEPVIRIGGPAHEHANDDQHGNHAAQAQRTARARKDIRSAPPSSAVAMTELPRPPVKTVE